MSGRRHGVRPSGSDTIATPQAGMAEMGAKFRAMGSEVSVDANKVRRSNEALA